MGCGGSQSELTLDSVRSDEVNVLDSEVNYCPLQIKKKHHEVCTFKNHAKTLSEVMPLQRLSRFFAFSRPLAEKR